MFECIGSLEDGIVFTGTLCVVIIPKETEGREREKRRRWKEERFGVRPVVG